MKRQALLYGSILALLAICIKWLEYRFVVLNYAIEIYGAVLAIIFTVLGLAIGRKLTDRKIMREEVIVERPVYIHLNTPEIREASATSPDELGLSKREMEILGLMAQGYSNQEIADRAFLSIHTVKTHASNLFSKLDVKRRTQAVSRAKELKLIP